MMPGVTLVVFLGLRLTGAAQLIANVIGLPLFIAGLILAARSVFVDGSE
jgi:purine-cytosine permease-like protein